jgi:hypothetical protein
MPFFSWRRGRDGNTERFSEDLKVGTCGGGTCAQVADAKYQNSEQKVIFYPYTQSGLSFFSSLSRGQDVCGRERERERVRAFSASALLRKVAYLQILRLLNEQSGAERMLIMQDEW